MSLGTLVVEAKIASGSMITAYQALSQNRHVMALPGSLRNPIATGCLKLIREGAECITCVEDVLAHFEGTLNMTTQVQQETIHSAVLNAIDFSSTSFDQIQSHTQIKTPSLLSTLTQLMHNGYIQPWESGWIRIQ